MAWTTDLVLMTRVLISDITVPQKYSDEYLQRVLVTAGIMVDAKVTFPYDYTYDLSSIAISPDPVVSKDSTFMALVPLKSACIITQGEFKKALGQGIKVRDGDSAIDTSVSFRGYRDILEFGPCAAYQKLEWSLIASGGINLIGKAVFGPFRGADETGLNTISWYYDQFAAIRNGRRDR